MFDITNKEDNINALESLPMIYKNALKEVVNSYGSNKILSIKSNMRITSNKSLSIAGGIKIFLDVFDNPYENLSDDTCDILLDDPDNIKDQSSCSVLFALASRCGSSLNMFNRAYRSMNTIDLQKFMEVIDG